MGQHLILYDGVCGLCNRLNQFVIARDSAGLFDFAAQQSDVARRLLAPFGKDPAALTTVYVIRDYRSGAPRLMSRARAVLFVLQELRGPWRTLRVFTILPDGVLNAGYDLVARYRYRLFGQYDQCRIPDAATRRRFIDV